MHIRPGGPEDTPIVLSLFDDAVAWLGSRFLDHAREQARARGVFLVRVDCWSGGDGALIRYYENQGFTPTERAPVGDREVQVFETRV